MRIGLLVTSVGNFVNKGFYNLQEVGLAHELDTLFDEGIRVTRVVCGGRDLYGNDKP